MNDRELMQQALVALGAMQSYAAAENKGLRICDEAIEALRNRLEKWTADDTAYRPGGLPQEEQELVAWLSTDSIGEKYLWFSKPLDNNKAQPLYTAPQKRKWQGLTYAEMRTLADEHLKYQPVEYELSGVFDLIRAVEAKLKEKND